MAYDVTLAEINAGLGGLTCTNTAWGFPVGTNFHTLLMSFWMCGPPGSTGTVGVWPAFDTGGTFNFFPGESGIEFDRPSLGTFFPFYQGGWTLPSPGVRMHFLMSTDIHTQVVQVYVNDAPVTLTSETWIGTPPYDFNVVSTGNIWKWDVSGAPIPGPGHHAGMGDAWVTNTPSFVDLSVVANRRKFINADLTPVDLGNTGTSPFGYQPALYMSVRPGGVAADILINRGLGGGAWSWDGSDPPTLQDPGACMLPPPPPPPPASTKLAMDNVICTAQQTLLSENLISLRWSDDRGHSYGSPVSQSIGEAGEYRTSLQWQRLAYARDRVFEISWSVPMRTALQGCWVDVTPAQS